MVVRADRYDAVVFDMDGVVTDTASTHEAAWARTFDEYLELVSARTGVPQAPFSLLDYLRYVDGRSRDDGVEGFLGSRRIVLRRGENTDSPADESVWGLANRKNDAFCRELLEHGARAFPTSVEFVHALQRAGVGTAVVSASRNAQMVLEAAGIGELFSVRVDGLESERLGLAGKPHPDLFVEATRRLDAIPARAVVVEDAIAGVQAGRAGGFGLVIGVDRAGQADALRSNGADAVVRDLAEIQVDTRRSSS